MPKIIKVCVDRIPKKEQGKKVLERKLALINGYKWKPGHIIRVRFMDGEIKLREAVKRCTEAWTDIAGINLVFNEDQDADIRISFKWDKSSWSAIGTDCQSILLNEPTMNFGWLNSQSTEEEIRQVVLHEFGHALGCIHEHQSPEATGIEWKKQTVYDYYLTIKPPWSRQQVDDNMFKTYAVEQTSYTELDPKSIMMYPIDSSWTENGFSVGWNTELSDKDKKYISDTYPKA